jgi:hypothetical protein
MVNNFDIRYYLEQRLMEKNAFWSFEKSSCKDLSDWNLIKYVLLRLDLDDAKKLFDLYPKKLIKEVWKEELASQGDYLQNMNFCYAVNFFDAKNPKQYIKTVATKRLNRIFKENEKRFG